MGKQVKMKCATCHKAFKTNKSSQLLCDECERKRRLEKANAQLVAAKPIARAATPSGARPAWLDGAVTTTVERPKGIAPGPTTTRPPQVNARANPPAPAASPSATVARVVSPKPKKEIKVPPKPPQPTPELVAAIEERYRTLAQPEFDGIRTQIAQEFGLPKSTIKTIVANLCKREHLPSWWDLQAYQGSPEDLERIKAAYLPYLPVPPIGVHRVLATELQLPPATIYHGIRTVRLALGLPTFNPPELHEQDMTDEQRRQTAQEVI